MRSYEKSIELLKIAREVTPLGAQTFSKSYRYFPEGTSPSFIVKGKGSRVWDIDGNEFVDFICGLGAITIGYCNIDINNAIIRQLENGISFSQPSPISIKLAEKLTSIIPCAEMVRFVKNGSDATSSAVRLARAYTNKEVILCSGYHGMHDWYIGSTPNNKGIPKSITHFTKSFTYNDLDDLEQKLIESKENVAAVILEPIQNNGPKGNYLKDLRDLTHQHNALLIFDEVVSGFRYALGGASEMYNIQPDLIAFGKGVANGMPLSCVAGRKDLLKQIEEGVFVSTTFGGETLSIASALATIEQLEKFGVYDEIWRLGSIMINGLKELIRKYQLDSFVSVFGLAPHAGLTFDGIGSLDYLDITSVFLEKMIECGILTLGVNNLMLAHTEEDINLYLNSADKALQNVMVVANNGSTSGLLKGTKVNPIFKRN